MIKHNLTIIDADSIVYLVGYRFKDVRIKSSALNALDDFIIDILKSTYSKEYIGVFGKHKGAKNFRYDIAKTKPYKGNRPASPDWYIYWEKIMKNHMEKIWKFIPVEYVEADDVCATLANHYKNDPKYGRVFVASPDKDLKQIGGVWNYNYEKRSTKFITEREGDIFLYKQSLQGDGSDNISGAEGFGKKSIEKAFEHITDKTNLYKYTKEIFKTWYHETLPAKQMKAAEKTYLINYKAINNIKRFNKKLKEEALQLFNKGGTIFKPSDKNYGENKFKEMLSLVYMLKTEAEIQLHWKDFKIFLPTVDEYIDWETVDQEKELIEGDALVDDFDEDFDFLNEDFDLLNEDFDEL
jgi:5'-3' exonuclease